MKEIQNVFIINPNIRKKCKKYIWFRGQDIGTESVMACNLLKFFLKRNLYIDGFVTDIKENVGICLWNKEIVYINDIEENCSLVFSENKVDRYPGFQSIVEINPLINKKNVVVYGAGQDGCHLLHAAENLELEISMFIDSNPEKVAKGMEGIPIYGVEMIDHISDDASIIVAASSVYQEIDQIINKHLPEKARFLYNLHFQHEELKSSFIYLQENELFVMEHVSWMMRIVQNKKIYIYGTSERSKKLIEIYELLDFNVIGYIDDEKKEYLDNRPVISLENATNDGTGFMLISRLDYRKNFEKLERMNFHLLKDYGFDNPFAVTYVAARNEIVDVNLGISYIGKQGVYGFTVVGNDLPSDRRIVILGSSIADGEFTPFRSWPEFLGERLIEDNVTIYNGAVAGYNTSQELLKLIRDVLYLKPDMVITYDGNIDITRYAGDDNTFIFQGLTTSMMQYVNSYGGVELDYYPVNHLPCTGIRPNVDRFVIWLNNIKRMKAVCTHEKIQFFSFLAPTLNSKPNKTKQEKGMLWSRWISNDYDKWAHKFRMYIKSVVASCDYIYDLSDIFDDVNDVYMDGYHVFEKGNKIIADSIYKVIKEAVKNIEKI